MSAPGLLSQVPVALSGDIDVNSKGYEQAPAHFRHFAAMQNLTFPSERPSRRSPSVLPGKTGRLRFAANAVLVHTPEKD
jgi:hypothetical protein